MTENTAPRVRIAPSPTGYLHLGTIRTALFNYLFAKKEKGIFILRIEDTDTERSLPIYEKDIIEGLKTLGISWDEGPDIGGPYGPYRQSERKEIYREYIKKLLDEKKAYWCFCSPQELEEERKAMLAAGIAPKYSGKCRHLTQKEVEEKIKSGQKGVIRIIAPTSTTIEFNDLIRGKITVSSEIIGDFVIAKDEETPLFLLANAIDDSLMKITHVIRGEDHISNTPRQIIIQKALNFEIPKYAHLPLILAPDRSKLSKRKMETSFVEYLKEGYLPEAILNFLVLLGWHPENDQEILSLEEMIKLFNLKRIQKSGAVFNVEKLDWFNAQYIKNLPLETLVERIKNFVPAAWLEKEEILKKAVVVERDRMKKLSEFKELAEFFFEIGEWEVETLRWQGMSLNKVVLNLKNLYDAINKIDEKDFEISKLEKEIMPLAETLGRGESLWPLRVALSGRKSSPGPFEIMWVLGKKETLSRIEAAIKKASELL